MRWAPLVLLLLCGCYGAVGEWGDAGPGPDIDQPGDDDDADDDDVSGVVPVSMTCSPDQNPVTFEWQQSVELQLSLEVEWSDGTFGPPTGPVTWTVLDGFGGSVDADGVYSPPSNHGGQVEIEAWYDGNFAVCSVDLYLQMTLDETGDATLADAASAGTPTVDDACAPTIVYPLSGAMVPRNLAPPTFQWTAVEGANVYVVTLSNDFAAATVVTSATSWRPDPGEWFALADSSAGDAVDLSVAAGTWDGASVTGLCTQATPLQFGIGDFGLEGTVYYWSPSTSGLWKIDVGSDVAESWLNPDNAGWCVGCHTVNLADATRMAMNYGGGNQWIVVSDPSTPLTPLMGPEQRGGNFTTLDPTGTRLVRSFEGTLYFDDVTTGAQLGAVPTTGYATHPDWSPDGSKLAYASCEYAEDNHDWRAHGCSIAVITVAGLDTFGSQQILVPTDSYSYYYPSFSPDSAWLSFNRAPNGSGGEHDSYDNPDAEVVVISSSGGAPTVLAAANGGTGLTNSWPRWGPSDGDVGWLAFASRRSYGNVTTGLAQVWIAAVDMSVIGTGPDPSYPPIWLPGQDPSVGNHTPVWVPRYVAPE